MIHQQQIAVLIPCYNEEVAIGAVVRDFVAALPGATVYVFDNNSSDRTSEIARENGAVVYSVPLQGKGNVVRRMFADIEADAYVLVDGDDTYAAASAPAMLHSLFANQLDMVVARRITEEVAAYRAGHRLGNWLLTECVARLFGRSFSDILSGYRVFSRRYVKSFPALANGFEIETELTVHALELRMSVDEIASAYKSRPVGSHSKLNTYRDGVRILFMIIKLFRMERPLAFFGGIAGLLAALATLLAIPLFITYAETGLVPRFPTAVLVTGMGITAALSAACGLILDTVTRGRQEIKRLIYLQIAPPQRPR
ncbi:glycosyltransferase family 2 protein [Janthinobacterium sp. RT4P48]|uniref:glycosyltransferase family 2 protein n=1 Tax=Janthinobacterium sp. RT4P48 TaxID=3424188 RepID=UPI003F24572A